jgi:hypothetical protein
LAIKFGGWAATPTLGLEHSTSGGPLAGGLCCSSVVAGYVRGPVELVGVVGRPNQGGGIVKADLEVPAVVDTSPATSV